VNTFGKRYKSLLARLRHIRRDALTRGFLRLSGRSVSKQDENALFPDNLPRLMPKYRININKSLCLIVLRELRFFCWASFEHETPC